MSTNQVFITGDTHFDIDTYKLKRFANQEDGGMNLTKDDYVIVCGDFGLLWNYCRTGKSTILNSKDDHWTTDEEKMRDWYDSLPWTTLFVDG